MRSSLRWMIGAVIAVLIVGLVPTVSAHAGPGLVAQNNWTLNLRATRFYNDPANARSGRDGWCYWGRDNPNAYACTVDTTNDRRPLRLEFPQCPSTDDPRICYKVDLASADPQHPGWNIRWRLSADPWYGGQMPYCQPDWVRWNRAYHSSPWTGYNHYRCGFWKRLYTGPA